jgi:hypothetical protein
MTVSNGTSPWSLISILAGIKVAPRQQLISRRHSGQSDK